MTITVNSPIVGYVPGIPEWPAGAARGDDLLAYFTELNRLCRLVNFDLRILYSQAHHETAGFTSRWWRERLNPAGIGITGDPRQNEKSHTWRSGTESARAHVVHMDAYVHGGLTLSLLGFHPLDPRLSAVFDAGYAGTVRTLGDLTGKWATDAREPDDPLTYAEKIAATANKIFKDPMQEEPVSDRPEGVIGCWWPGDGRMEQPK